MQGWKAKQMTNNPTSDQKFQTIGSHKPALTKSHSVARGNRNIRTMLSKSKEFQWDQGSGTQPTSSQNTIAAR